MKLKLTGKASYAILATGLLLGAAAAQAATGYNVRPTDESQVKPGMTASQVMQTLGRPAERIKFGNEPGPTLEYHVLGHESALFDVDMDGHGRVASTGVRQEVSNSGGAMGDF